LRQPPVTTTPIEAEKVQRRVADAFSRAVGRVVADAWPILQGAIASTMAWVFAKYVFDHPEPFFAPVAAIIALNTTLGERGLNAVRLLHGVVIGIVVGELAIAALGSGWGTLALGTFVAVVIARAVGGTRIVLAQAATGAILVITVANPEAGLERLLDALIGGGVALVFSNLLFSPEPLALLRRAEAAALADMAEGVGLTAKAMEQDDDELREEAMRRLRELRDRLADLARMRRASTRVARRSLAWRSHSGPVVQESENAGHLDLLGGSCLLLARTATATTLPGRRKLVGAIHELASALTDLSRQPADLATREAVTDRALGVMRMLTSFEGPQESFLGAAVLAARIVAADIMLFAGVDVEDVAEAVREGTGELKVPAPPSAPRVPFG
jgi:hypothetical protein